MKAEDIQKALHEAVAPIFKELAEEVAESFKTNKVLNTAMEKIERLEAEIKALRKARGDA
jgi:archaellum component FlaC